MPDKAKDDAHSEQVEILKDLRDISDLCIHWPQLKPILERAIETGDLDENSKRLLRWLSLLADRIHHSSPVDD